MTPLERRVGRPPKPKDKRKTREELERENHALRHIVRETIWMARRYADGRSTYAPSMVNEAITEALRLGIQVDPDGATEKIYADDGMFGAWDPERGRFVKENGP